MAPEDLFSLAGTAAMAGWGVLILAPRRWAWLNLVPALVIPAGLSALYAALVLRHFAGADGGFGSLAAVATLFSDPWVLLAGWVHYLAFDLAVGAWSARLMDRTGVNRIVQVPLLLTVFLFGPAGFLLVLIVAGAMRAPVLSATPLNKDARHVYA